MDNSKNILIDEEPIIFYSSNISNYGVHSKSSKCQKNINISFSPLSTNRVISFANTIMYPVITTEATLDTEKNSSHLDNEKFKQSTRIKSETSKDEKNNISYEKQESNIFIINNDSSIQEDEINEKNWTNNKEHSGIKRSMETNPFYLGGKFSFEMNKLNFKNHNNTDLEKKKVSKILNKNEFHLTNQDINFSKTSKILKEVTPKSKFITKRKHTANLKIRKKTDNNEKEMVKNDLHKRKVRKTTEIFKRKKSEKEINLKNNLIKPRSKIRQRTIISRSSLIKLKDNNIKMSHTNLDFKGNSSSKLNAIFTANGTIEKGEKESRFKIRSKKLSENKIIRKLNIETPKNGTKVKLTHVYPKKFTQNVNVKNRKLNTSINLKLKKVKTFENEIEAIEKKKTQAPNKKKSADNKKNFDFESALKNKKNLGKTQFNLFSPDKFTNTEFCGSDYCEYTLDCMDLLLSKNKTEKQQKSKVNFNFPKTPKNKKKKIALFDLDETLVHCTGDISTNNEQHQHEIKITLPGGKEVTVGINIRPFWKKTLNLIKKHYIIVVFTASHQAYADAVLDFMDPDKKYFKYRLYRNNCSLVEIDEAKFYVKDLDIFDEYYDLKDIVIIDNSVLSFIYHLENGIPIVPYYNEDKDGSLYVVGLYLNHIYKENDLREANKNYINLDSFLNEARNRRDENKEINTINEESISVENGNNNNNTVRGSKSTIQIKLSANKDKTEISEKDKRVHSCNRRNSTCFSTKNEGFYPKKLITKSKLMKMYYSINDKCMSNKNITPFMDNKCDDNLITDDEKEGNENEKEDENDKDDNDLFFKQRLYTTNDGLYTRNDGHKGSNKTCIHYLDLKLVRSNFYSNFSLSKNP